MWKTFVVAVVLKRPEKIPIPLFKNRKNKLMRISRLIVYSAKK